LHGPSSTGGDRFVIEDCVDDEFSPRRNFQSIRKSAKVWSGTGTCFKTSTTSFSTVAAVTSRTNGDCTRDLFSCLLHSDGPVQGLDFQDGGKRSRSIVRLKGLISRPWSRGDIGARGQILEKFAASGGREAHHGCSIWHPSFLLRKRRRFPTGRETFTAQSPTSFLFLRFLLRNLNLFCRVAVWQ